MLTADGVHVEYDEEGINSAKEWDLSCALRNKPLKDSEGKAKTGHIGKSPLRVAWKENANCKGKQGFVEDFHVGKRTCNVPTLGGD